jgi:protein-disulfide isomerase
MSAAWWLTAAVTVLGVQGMAIAQGGASVEGKADSPVRAIIYEDLHCSDCALFRQMLDQKLLPKYNDKVAFVHRDFPLAKHPLARPAAIAARYFGGHDPQLGVAFRREVFAAMEGETEARLRDRIAKFAAAHRLKPEEALAALEDAALAAAVEKDYQDGVARGVSRTPTVFVNGRPFVETFTAEEISKGIDQALAETH